MKFQLNIVVTLILICVCGYTMMEVNSGNTELHTNALKFGYGINKYVGTLSHSFDRFYVVTKFEFLAFCTIKKALHKVVQAMENKVDLQCNKIFHLEDSMVMYGIYNSDTLET